MHLRGHLKEMGWYTLIIILTNSSSLILGVVKTAIIAKTFDSETLNAYSISMSIIVFVSYILIFYNFGLISLLTKESAKEQHDTIGKRINVSQVVGLVFSGVLYVTIYLLKDLLIPLYNPSPRTSSIVRPFFPLYAATIPLLIFGSINGSLLVGLGYLLPRMAIELLAVATDILFAYLFINVLHLGLDSVTYSTLLGRALCEALHYALLYRPLHREKYSLLRRQSWQFLDRAFWASFVVGSGYLIGRGALVMSQITATVLLVSHYFGGLDFSCYTIMINLYFFSPILSDAIGITISIKGAEFIAKRMKKEERSLLKALPICSLAMVVLFMFIYGVFRTSIFKSYAGGLLPHIAPILSVSWPFWLVAVALSCLPGPYEGMALARGEYKHLFVVFIGAIIIWGLLLLLDVWGWDWGAQKGWWSAPPILPSGDELINIPLVWCAFLLSSWVRFLPFCIVYTRDAFCPPPIEPILLEDDSLVN
eukprot:TRINITY_DN5689_c0_g1_i2.p1 TRINITY_DN5689_c0_g1~~TRINITY_DN5689_c0_g1_i2.p1  ORF type:complete len:479 (+),score=94.48 TRINITY_DN5689_c0_g1_i2:42-1478(+)